MAGSSGAIRAGRAFVELFADDGPLQKGLKKAETVVKNWGSKVTSMGAKALAVGTAAMAPLAGATKNFATIGAELTDMSRKTGASTESLSTLGYAAKQTGADASQVAGAMNTVRDKIVDAAKGGEESQLAFARLGLSFQQLSRMKPDERFRAIGEQLNKIPNPAMRAALATQALGSADLLPMIEQMGELEKRARALGLEFSSKDAAAAKKLEMGITDLWETTKMLGNQIGSALAPTLTEWASNATQIAVKTGQWIKANKDTIVTVFKVAAGVAAAGAGVVVLGTALTYGAGILGTIAAALSFLLSPIGLVSAAVIGLGTLFVTKTESGKQALGWLIDKFEELKTTAEETFGGISDALSAGDIGLAMEILWLTLKVEWQKGVNFLLEYWTNFKTSFRQVAVDAFYGVLEIANNVWSAMRTGWADFVNWFTNKWKAAQLSIAEKTIDIMAYFDSSIDADDAKGILKDDANRDQNKRDTGHAQNLKQIEKDRLAREDGLAGDNIAANDAIGEDGKAEIQARKDALEATRQARKDALNKAEKLRQEGTPEAQKVEESASAGLGAMHKQVQGIGATDVRSTSGFKAITDSLKQAGPQEKMAQLMETGVKMQQDQAHDEKRTRIAVENIKVRDKV